MVKLIGAHCKNFSELKVLCPFVVDLAKAIAAYINLKVLIKSSVQLGGEGCLGLHIEQHEKFGSVELVSLPHCEWKSSKTRLRLCSSCTWQLYHPKGLADEAVSVLWCRLLSCLPAYVCYRRELGAVRLWNLAKGHSEWVHLQHIDMEKKPSAWGTIIVWWVGIVRTRKFWAACTCGHGINFLSFMDQLSFFDFSRIKHHVFFVKFFFFGNFGVWSLDPILIESSIWYINQN